MEKIRIKIKQKENGITEYKKGNKIIVSVAHNEHTNNAYYLSFAKHSCLIIHDSQEAAEKAAKEICRDYCGMFYQMSTEFINA